ncbi:hypothetical protein Cwoe_3657 [Conexibacter woesei DSM 14684]|uniref:Uncharacterized protein n=1 Tax=Conexibacter woesei (strain DSM 14684 / CCUG 47730 / CIP 108061 / JCM 11494 / NBRC 100937 / ID131577) TaxID=469383 RepID=D3F1B1_CONWI|nr:hypothetical protein Cwoe_3657 [Conexibacter woesei DSM 14684]
MTPTPDRGGEEVNHQMSIIKPSIIKPSIIKP